MKSAPLHADATEQSGTHKIHNHPSGIAEPSSADIMMTGRIKRALALIEIRLVDHLIVGESVFSMAERGLLS